MKGTPRNNSITYLKFCAYCKDDKGHSRAIPESQVKHARHLKDGTWKCGICITKDLLKLTGHR